MTQSSRLCGFSALEDDVAAFVMQPWTATSTDVAIALPEEGSGTHARFYGSYPRNLRHYTLDRGVIIIEHAVRSSTSLPAQILGIKDRGLIRKGMAADLVVLDPIRVRDKSAFSDTHQYSEGIDLVLVNGKPVVEGGKLTGALAGKVLEPHYERK